MSLSLARAKTLIVDDFQGMRTMFKDFCKQLGISDIEVAGNGKDALALLAQNRFDIVICDYNLGPGRSGQQVLEEAKFRNYIGYGTIWVIITAEKTTEMVVGAVEAKPDDYLLKPINAAMLESRLNKLILKKQSFGEIEAAVREHDYPKAMALCDSMMKSQSAAQDLLRIKTDLLTAMGDLDGARSIFQSVLVKRSVPWAKTGLGKIYFQQKDFAHARDLFREVLDESPMYLEAADWLAKAHDALGEGDQAQAVLQRAMELSPQSTVRQKNLADVAYKNGALDVAKTAYEKAIKHGEHSIYKSASNYAGLAKALTEGDAPQEAFAVLERGKQAFRDDPEMAVQSAVVQSMAFNKMGDHAKASAAIEEAAKLMESMPGKVSADVSMDMAKSLFSLGKKDQACELLQNAVMEKHDDAAFLAQIQGVFESQQMSDIGKDLIEKSRQEVVDINNQGVKLAHEGKFEEAVILLREAVARLPNNIAMVNNLCGMLIAWMKKTGLQKELIVEARHLLDRVHDMQPEHPKYHEYMNALTRLT